MVLLFYVDFFLMFSTSKDKIEEVFTSLQTEFKIEDGGDLNKHLRIELDHRPDGSVHLSEPYLTQRIIDMITGMENSSTNPTPPVKPNLDKNEGDQARKNYFSYRSVIGSLNFLTNLMRPEAQFAVHQCRKFRNDSKLPHDQYVKSVLKYLKGTSNNRLIMKPDPEKGIECCVDADFT